MNNIPKAFDYLFYCSYYPDLNNIIGPNEELLKKHYLNYGRFEGRKYCNLPDKFNWVNYINYIKMKDNSIIDSKEEAIYHYITFTAPNVPLECLDSDSDLNTDKPIYIVYFCFLNKEKCWMSMIHDQLNDVKNTGILNSSNFHAVIYGEHNDIIKAHTMMETLICQKIQITPVYTNRYEFPAIIKIRELAIENPDKIFIYFHSKGMVNHNSSTYRTHLERKLTLSTFLNWDETLYKFNTNPNIQKAGLMPSPDGLIWFNFWWARGLYIASCEPIIESDDRFACEVWLGLSGSNTYNDCYSLIDKKISFTNDPSSDCWNKTCCCYDY